ncbi:hypothetical protein LWI28_014840 [Acer negundo]|uniref:BRCT domain-containing protein n=1 Tax=Acer negundo TaxID=4023 RepID=A0AAD5NUN5_ACENE|nr:hypothetical protein LWI28_014840 [Acer negundo]
MLSLMIIVCLGVEKIDENENECQRLEDAMMLDSPLAETRMEKLDETQVLEDCGCFEDLRLQLTSGDEEEVVLDSEDEGICRNKTVGVPIRFSGGNALNLRKRRAVCVDKQCGVGNKGCERTDEQKDLNHEFAKLNYVDSQEPGQSSQDNALEFVDQFLSINGTDLSPGIGVMKTVRDLCPPVSGAKGPQTLVKRLKSRTPISKTGIFEWADGDQHVKDDVISKRIEASFQSETRSQKALHTAEETCGIKRVGKMHLTDNSVKESNEDLPAESSKHQLNTGGIERETAEMYDIKALHTAEETCGIKRVGKMNLTDNSVKESNEDLPAESSKHQLNTGGIERETAEMYDIGFNTQIAAEAMEALSYGPSAGCVAFDVFQGSSNAPENSPKSVIMGEAHPEHNLIQKSLGGIARKSKRGKRSARKYGKNSNNQKLDPCDSELATMTRVKRGKSLITGQCHQRNANVRSESRPPRLIVQRQIDGTVGGNNDSENYMNSSISVECISLSKEQAGTRQSLAGGTSTRTNNQSDNPAQRTEDGILRYRRKRSRLDADPTRTVSARGRWSELHYNSSAESRNSKLGEKEQTYQEVTATTSCLKMDIWSHPKRKRTLCKMQSHSNGANNISGSQRTTEDNDRTTRYNRDMKKNAESGSGSPSQHSSENNVRKKFDKRDLEIVISNCESATMSKKISPGELDNLDAFMQSDKRDGIDCVLFGVEKNHKFVGSSYKHVETHCSGYVTTTNNTKSRGTNTLSSNNMSSKKYEHPSNKNLPKSSLLKELIRLGGVPESIPDSSWKDLRRQRDLTYVKVLFSQHLDDDVIKQQKKQISARLGISIASCSMDATHFIADRFVRTRNMLEAIALAKPVVTPLWLDSCGQASCLIDKKNYILRDAKKEKEIGFSLPVSFARASQHPLLKGRRVFITPNIKPQKEMITSLVKLVHGQVVERSQIPVVKDQKIQDDLLILSCEEDRPICVPFLDQGLAAYSSELLLNGIVIQKLEFERSVTA